MLRSFDGSFWAGTLFTALSLAIVVAVATSATIPVIGSGRIALLVVGLLGLAACMVAGIDSAPAAGTSVIDPSRPSTVVGAVLGFLALGIIVVGLVGMDSLLRPFGQILPAGVATGEGATQRIAIVALGTLIAAKWLIALVLTTFRVFRIG